MGNAIITAAGAGGARKAKIMKINGEFFELGTPAKVADIIENYPGHVLLDSNEFLRFNLRARPLDPEFELQPKKIYLLVELPRFPTAEEADYTLQRTNSAEILDDTIHPPENFGKSQVLVTDFSATARSEAGEGPAAAAAVTPVRVKLKLPKAQVERILEQSSDDAEAAEKIIDLCMDDGGGRATEEVDTAGEEEEESAKEGRWTEIGEDETMSFSKYRVNSHHPRLRIPGFDRHSKYKKLANY